MSALEVFDFQGSHVRTSVIDGEAIFLARDVCAAVGISKQRDAVAQLEADERASMTVDTPGGPQVMTAVTEPGIYSLMMISRSPLAKAFKRWVTHEVLPAIRRTGSYEVQPQFKLPATFSEALRELATTVEELESAKTALELAAPKVEAYERLIGSDGLYDMDGAAKSCGWGRNRMMAELRKQGILQGNNLPYQRYAHHFEVKLGTYLDRHGVTHPTATTKVKPEGMPWLLRRLAQVTF